MAGYTIPNNDLAAFPVQSQIFETDLSVIAAGYAGYRVVSGCAVTAQGTPDMTVAVAAGRIRPGDETLIDVSADASLAIDAADATLWRLDLVSAASDGTVTHTSGTAATLTAVKPPALPAGHVALAFVTVPPAATEIDSDQIVDKRLFMASPEPIDPVDHGNLGATPTFDYADGSDHKGTLNAVPTITLAGPSSTIAQYLFLHLTEDGSGGHINSAIWDPSAVWEGGTVPTFDDSPGAEIGVAFWSDDGGLVWHGFTKFGAVGPAGTTVFEDLTTSETDTALVAAPDGAGGLEFRAEAGGSALAAASYVRASGDYTTSSTSFVDVDATNMKLTITTGAHRVLIGAALSLYGPSGENVCFDVLLDGTRIGGTDGLARTKPDARQIETSFVWLTAALTAASHEFRLQWRSIGGATVTLVSGPCQFWVVEQGA